MVAIVSGSGLGLHLASSTPGAGVAGNAAIGNSGEKAYVNSANGNLVLQDRDDLLVGPGIDIATVRTYNSQGIMDAANGNWRIGFYRSIVNFTGTLNQDGSTVTRIGSDGSAAVYRWSSERSLYLTSDGDGAYDTLTFDAGANRWNWTDGNSGLTESYDWINGRGRLASQADRSGNQLTYRYSGDMLSEVASQDGEKTVLDYAAGKLASVHALDKNGQSHTRVRYGYDEHDRLASVTVDLSPDDNSIADGKVYITHYTYDGDSQRIASVAQSDGSLLRFDYIEVKDAWRVHSLRQVVDGVERATTFDYTDLVKTVPASAGLDSSKLATTVPDIASLSAAVDASRLSTVDQQRVDRDANLDSAKLSTTSQQVDAHDVAIDAGKLSTTTTVIENHADHLDAGKLSTSGTRIDAHTANVDSAKLSTTVTTKVDNHTPLLPGSLATTDSSLMKTAALDSSKLVTQDLEATTAKFILRPQRLAWDGELYAFLDSSKLPYRWPASGGWSQVGQDLYGNTAPEAALKLQALMGNPSYSPGDLMSGLPDYFSYDPARYYSVTSGTTWASIAGRVYGTTMADAGSALAAAMGNIPLVSGARLTNFPPTISIAVAAGTAVQPYYKVRPGDTWQSVASALYGTADNDIANLLKNMMGSPELEPDGRLTGFPKSLSAPSTVAPYYTVQYGDTWESITGAHYITRDAAAVAALKAALNNPPLTVGSKLTGFPDSLNYTSTVNTTVPAYYRILAGDSWAAMAVSLYGVPEGDAAIAGRVLQAAMGNVELTEGTTLAGLPATLSYKTSSTISVPPYYTVGVGDNWSTIAVSLYGSSAPQAAAALQQAMGSVALEPGTQLSGLPAVLEYTTSSTITVPAYYTVRRGDSWTSIAQNLYGSGDAEAAAALQAAMGNAALDEGNKLTGLPATLHYTTISTITVPAYYLVQPGDSWASIAAALFGDTSAEAATALQAAMGNAALDAGTRLANLPAALHYSTTVTIAVAPYYTVQQGDSWSSIAMMLYHTADSEAAAVLQTALGAPPLVAGTRIEHLPAKLDYLKTVGVKQVPAYYLVQAGDSWESITRALYGTGDPGAIAALRAARPDAALDAGVRLDQLPATLGYSRDVPDGVRVRVTDALGNGAVFTSDAQGRLASVQAPAAQNGAAPSVAYTYDGAGNVLTQTDGNGAVTRFEYDSFGNQVKVTDALGNITERTFNNANKLLSEGISFNASAVSGPDRHVQNARMVYDAAQRLRFAIGREGAVTEYRYDAVGQCVSTIAYTGNTWTAPGQPLEADLANWVANSADKARSMRTDTVYDFRGQVSQVTEWSAVDGDGKGVADGKQAVTSFVYSQAGQLLKTIAPDGATATLTYDGLGRVLSRTDAAGAITTTVYDDAGQQSVVRMANGLFTTSTFNSVGELVSLLQSDGSRTLGEARYWYDADGRLRLTQGADGTKTAVLYDAAGRKAGEIDAAGALTEYQYDADNRLVHTIRYATPVKSELLVPATADLRLASNRAALESVLAWTLDALRPQGGPQDVKSWNFYDALGRLNWQVDGMGYATQTLYDGVSHAYAVNRLAVPVDTALLGNGIGVALRLRGHSTALQLAESIGPDGVHSYTAVVKGQVAAGSPGEAQGTVTFFAGSAVLGSAVLRNGVALFSGALPAGRSDISAVYSGDGANAGSTSNTVATNVASAPVNSAASAQMTIASVLLDVPATPVTQGTSLQLRAQVGGNLPSGVVTFVCGKTVLGVAEVRDGVATLQLAAVDLPAGDNTIIASYAGDTANQPAMSTSCKLAVLAGAKSIALDQDAADRKLVRYFDKNGQVRCTIDAEGYMTEYRYDAAGRLVETIAYATQTAQRNIDLAQGDADLFAGAAPVPQSSAADIHSFVFYNSKGQKAGELNAEGYLTEYAYDSSGRLETTRRYANKALGTYSIDAKLDTLRPAATGEDQLTVQKWNILGQLESQTEADGSVTSFVYNNVGVLTGTTLAKGSADERTMLKRYDLQGRVVAELPGSGAALLRSDMDTAQVDAVWAGHATTYTYDQAGHRTSMKDALGNRSLFFYDDAGRLRMSVNGAGNVIETGYDTLGRVSSTTVYATVVAANVLAALQGGLLSGAADAAGALAQAKQAAAAQNSVTRFSYNAGNALVQTSKATGAVDSVSYNAFGEAVASTGGIDNAGHGVTTMHSYDRRGLETATSTSANKVSYATSAQYDAFGRMVRSVDANGNVTQQDYDKMGRLVTTTDPMGGKRKASYDAFGRVLTQTDALSRTSIHSYNTAARSTTVTTPEGVSVTTALTRNGQTLSISDGNGNVTRYSYDKDGRLLATDGALGGTRAEYDVAGQLVKSRDANGNEVNYTYDGAQRILSSVADVGGSKLVTRFAYDGKGQRVSVTDASGTVTRTDYDLAGQAMTQTVDPDGLHLVTSYTHDVRGNLLTVVSAGGMTTQYVYDDLGRRIRTVADPNGLKLAQSFSYDNQGNLTASRDAQGNLTRYAVDANGRLVYTVDPLGYVSKNDYDAEGRIIAVTRYAKPLSLGGLAESLSPAAVSAIVVATPAQDRLQYHVYNKDGQLAYDIDGMGSVTRYVRDSNGNVTLRRKYAASIDMSKWVPGTEPAVAADQLRDAVLRTVYDALNRPLYTIDGNGNAVEMRYDSVGNLLERIAYAAPVPPATGATVADMRAALSLVADASRDTHVRNVYDSANRLLWSVDGLGQVTGYSYDGDGNVVKQVAYANRIAADAAPASVLAGEGDRVVLNAYDSANRLKLRVDADGSVTGMEYDANSNIVKTTAYAKPQPRPTAGSSAPGVAEADAARDHVLRKVYDALGREIYSIDSMGAVVATRYDSNGHAIEKTSYASPVPTETPATATAIATALAAVADANRDVRMRYVYDADGRMTWSVDGCGAVAQFSYDQNNNLITRREYTDLLSPASLALLASDISVLPTLVGAARVTQLVYDADNRLVFTIDPLGAVSGKRYDAAGNVFETVRYATAVALAADAPALSLSSLAALLRPDPANDVHQFQRYDANGRLVWSVDALGAVTHLSYDAKGNVVSRVAYATALSPAAMAQLAGDPAGVPMPGAGEAITNYVYGADNRLVFTIDALGAVNENRYDASGNAIETVRYATAWQGARSASAMTATSVRALLNTDAAKDIHQRNRYDGAGRLIWSIDGLGGVTEHRYDANGNLSRTIVYASALAGTLADGAVPQVLATAPGSGAYLLSSALDRVTDYVYDRKGRLIGQTDGVGTTAATSQSWAYDIAGNIIRHTDGRGNTSWSAYDAAGRLLRQVDAAGYVTVRSYYADGRAKSETRYTNPVALPAVANDAWAYDAAANPVANTDPVAGDQTTSWAYDGAGRMLTSTDAAGGVTSYTYDSLGNLTDTTVAYGTAAASTVHRAYDRASRVVAETRAFGTVDAFTTQYGYDTWGNQTSITAGGLTTLQYFDALGRKTGVKDGNQALTTTTYNAFGDIVKVTDARGNAGYFYTDALGRVTMQVDPEGSVSGTRYDLQGNVVNVIRYASKVPGAVSELARPQVTQTQSDQYQQNVYDALGRKTETRTWYDGSAYYTESFTYDANGNKKTSTARNGGVTTYDYDKNNRLLSETLPIVSKNAANVDVAVQNRLEYDARGNVVKKTEAYGLPEQRVTTYVFDKLNRQVKEVGEAINTFDATSGQDVLVTPTKTHKFDLRGNLIEESDARGARTLHFYDGANRETGRIDPAGTFTRYTYDSAGNKANQTIYANAVQVVGGGAISSAVPPVLLAPASALPGSGAYLRLDAASDRTTSFTYDGVGRLKTTAIDGITTGVFNKSTNHYVVGSGTVRTQTFYDATGNVVKTIDANGNVTRNYYNRAGRLMAQLDASRYLTVYQFDAFGNVDTQATYANAIAASVAIDDSTSLQQLTLVASSDDRITKFTYDRMGRTKTESRLNLTAATVDATTGAVNETTGAATTSYEYDGLSDVTRRTDANGVVTDWQYDAMGRKTRELQAAFTDYRGVSVRTTTDFEYDGLDHVLREIVRGEDNSTEADDRITRYFYGAGGFLIGQTDPANAHLDYRIDAAGNITRKTLVNRHNADGGVVNDVTSYCYDALGRETRHTDGATGTVAETRYNAFGEITGKRTNPQAGSTDWAEFTDYDQAGHAWRTNAGDGITHVYLYDANGNATLKLDDPVTDLRDSGQKTWTLLGVLNLLDTNQFYSVYDARNQLSDTFQPSMDGSHNIITVEESLTQKQGTSFAGIGGVTMGVAAGLNSAAAAIMPTASGAVSISPALSAAVTLTDRYTTATKYYEDGPALRSASHTLTVNLPDTSAWGAGAVRVDISIPESEPLMGYQGSFYPSPGASTLNFNEDIDWECTGYPAGRNVTITIYKEGPAGAVVIGTQTLWRNPGGGTSTVNTAIATSGNTVRFTDQRPDTSRLVLMTRPIPGAGGWTVNNVSKAIVNGVPQDGSFSFDWSAMPQGSYEFRYVCFNGSNEVVNSQQGTMVLSSSTPTISQTSHTMGGPGRAFVDASGNIVFNELGGQATSLTVSYRQPGGAWSTQVLSPSTVGGSVLPGWFTFATGGLAGSYEYTIEAKNPAGTTLNKSSSSFTVGPTSVNDPSGVSVQTPPAASLTMVASTATAVTASLYRSTFITRKGFTNPPIYVARNPVNRLTVNIPSTSAYGDGNVRIVATVNPSVGGYGGSEGSYSGANASVEVSSTTGSVTLDLNETSEGAGGKAMATYSYTVYKKTSCGEVVIGSYSGVSTGPSSGATTWSTAPQTTPNLVTFAAQPAVQGATLLLEFRRHDDSSGPWDLITVPAQVINGQTAAGRFALDWTTWPADTYEYRTVFIDAVGNTLQTGAGTMHFGSPVSVTPQQPDLIGGPGRVYMDRAGNLVFTEQSAATDTLTIRYRRKGSEDLWSARVDVPRTTVPGWFVFTPTADVPNEFEYVLEARHGGQLLNKIAGTFTKGSANSASPLTGYSEPPVVTHFTSQPANTATVRLSYRPSGGGAYTTVNLTKVTTGLFDWASGSVFSSDTANANYDYIYESLDSNGVLLNKAHGVVTLGRDPKIVSHISDSLPTLASFNVPDNNAVAATATSMVLRYRLLDSASPFATIELTQLVNGAFVWDASALVPPGTSGAIDYSYTLKNGSTVLKRDDGADITIDGTLYLGPTNGDAQLKWLTSGTVNSSALIHHAQATNAFGEVVSETNARGFTTVSVYNALGKLVRKEDPDVSVTLSNGFQQTITPRTYYYYDRAGRMLGSRDANGNLTSQALLGAGTSVLKEYHADGGNKSSGYNIFGDVVYSVDEIGLRTDYSYDKDGRLTLIRRPLRTDGARAEVYMTYDEAGNRITQAATPDANSTLASYTSKTYYDSLGRVSKVLTPAGRGSTYTYVWDSNIKSTGGRSVGGWRQTVSDPMGRSVIDEIDAYGRTTAHTDLGGHKFIYTFNTAGWITGQSGNTGPNGTVGQNIAYTYYANGYVRSIRDVALNTETTYEYDAAGNRTYESYQRTVNGNVEYLENASIDYDSNNRVTRIHDPRSDIQYEYDAVGNRRRVHSMYHDGVDGSMQVQDYWYDYDSMNRFVLTMGKLSSANGARASSATDTSVKVVLGDRGSEGVQVQYNKASQRIMTVAARDGHREDYTYGAEGYLESTYINADASVRGALASMRTNDRLGRTTGYTEYNTNGNISYQRSTVYTADGRQKSQTGTDGTTTYYYYNQQAGGVDSLNGISSDGVGELAKVQTTKDGAATITTVTAYDYWDDAKQRSLTVNGEAPYKTDTVWRPGVSSFAYDVNGHLAKAVDAGVDGKMDTADDVTFNYISNGQGLVLRREQFKGNTIGMFHRYMYLNGNMVGDVGNDGDAHLDYAQTLARQSTSREEMYKNWRPISSADFDQNYLPINREYPAATGSSYTVKAGDSLYSIAGAVWGDVSMWYLIADANGLTAESELSAGQTLVIPNKVTNIHNNSGTFRPYNPGEIIGDTSPTLPDAPPPAPPPGHGGGCGTVGMIVMIVVAVVVTVLTAGAAAAAMAAAESATAAAAGTAVGAAVAETAAASAWAAGGMLAAGTTGLSAGMAFAAGAIGSAVGSIASQAVGMAMGVQDKFSWKSVALSAIGGGASAGVASLASGSTGAMATVFKGTDTSAVVARSLASNIATQGIGVVTGLQNGFNWRGVAAAGVGATAGSWLNNNIPKDISEIIRNTAVGFGAGMAAAAAHGGRISVSQIATDAFGNALGSSMAEQMDPDRRLNELNERMTARARARVEPMPTIEALPVEPIIAPDFEAAISNLQTVVSEPENFGASFKELSRIQIENDATAAAGIAAEFNAGDRAREERRDALIRRSISNIPPAPEVVVAGASSPYSETELSCTPNNPYGIPAPRTTQEAMELVRAMPSVYSGYADPGQSAVSAEPGIRGEILDKLRYAVGKSDAGQVGVGFVKSWLYFTDNMVDGVKGVPDAFAGAYTSVRDRGFLETWGSGVDQLSGAVRNTLYGSGEARGAFLFNVVTAPAQAELGSIAARPVKAASTLAWEAAASGVSDYLSEVYLGERASPLAKLGTFDPLVNARPLSAVPSGPSLSISAASNSAVDSEVSALQRIAANNAVVTGSAARMARIDELAANNYNRLLTQDLSTNEYVYRGVNANMIDVYEAQGAITGRGGSPTYFSLDVGADGAEHMLGAQMPSSPQVMLKIPTSELVDPMVPRPDWGGATSGWEYYTNSYPKWGYGGYRQFVGTTSSFSRDWIVPGWSK